MKYLSFYQSYLPKLSGNTRQQNVLCPFHEDTTPSCSIDIESGLWFCHGCQRGGDIFSFYMEYHGCSFAKAKNAILGNEQVEILSEAEVKEAHTRLLNSESLQKLIAIKKGWSLDTIKEYGLGWQNERVYIPVRNKENTLQNIRKYDILHKTKQKFIGIKGFNQVQLWPIKALEHETVVICAGEPDTISARQLGINAITFTVGEGAFRAELLPEFKDKITYIVYDIDNPGKIAAKLLSQKLVEYAKSVNVINLPEKILPPNGDLTDLIFHCYENEKDFTNIWNPCVELAIKVEKSVKKEIEFQEVDFYSAVKNDCYDANIQFKAIAIGKNLSPYFSPVKAKAKCNFTRGDTCKSCILFATGGEHEVNISEKDALNLIKCTQGEQRSRLRDLIGIQKCGQFELGLETNTIEEIYISPLIDSERIDQQFITRKAYTFSHNLQLNKTYSFLGKTISDPKTQEATHLFIEQKPELSNLETFALSELDKGNLKIFQPKTDTVESIDNKLQEIYKDFTYNIPEVIIGRENLLFAFDLVFHSVLLFKFAGKKVSKGWVEALILGDTRTGKSKSAEKLLRHYRAGESITLEGATRPGLVGGMSSVGKESVFSWGILPINDGRLVILDEVNGLSIQDISDLSAIRDKGEAERTLVGSTRRTSARVRIIWLSNPRTKTKRIENYTSGVDAIRELIGGSEDIARFDFAVIAAEQDITSERINIRTYPKVQHIYTSDLCNKLVLWAWSRRENNVKFAKNSEKEILEAAIEMSAKYVASIPLVQAADQRIKLARLAIALACRLFSTEDGEDVIVKPEHVQYIIKFLYQTYNSTYFGYGDYSTFKKEESVIQE